MIASRQPATAVAISQKKHWPPRSQGSASTISTTGWPASASAFELLLPRGIPGQPDRAEEAVAAVNRRRPDLLPHDRQDPLPLLPRALRKELLHPVAERRQAAGKRQGELVAALGRKLPEKRPEDGTVHPPSCAGKFTVRGRRGPLQEELHIHPDQRRRDEAEAGEGRIAPADLRVVEEGVAEMVPPGEIRQRAPGIGDREEMFSRLLLPELIRNEVIKIFHEGEGLDRPARFRGDDKERPAEVEAFGEGQDRPRVRAVQDGEVEEAVGRAEDLPENLGREAGPPIPRSRAKLKPSARIPSTTAAISANRPASPAGCRASRGGLRSPQARASRRYGPSAGSVPRPARPPRPCGPPPPPPGRTPGETSFWSSWPCLPLRNLWKSYFSNTPDFFRTCASLLLVPSPRRGMAVFYFLSVAAAPPLRRLRR